MNTVKLMNTTAGRSSAMVFHEITVFCGEEPGFCGDEPGFRERELGASRRAGGDWRLPMSNEDKPAGSSGPAENVGAAGDVGPIGKIGKLAKLSRSGDRDLPADTRRESNWSHGIGEVAPEEGGVPAKIRERARGPARGIVLAFAVGLILWVAGIYLIATLI